MTVETHSKPTARRSSPGSTDQAVWLTLQLRHGGTGSGAVGRFAGQLGIDPALRRSWVRRARGYAGTVPSMSTADAERFQPFEQEAR